MEFPRICALTLGATVLALISPLSSAKAEIAVRNPDFAAGLDGWKFQDLGGGEAGACEAVPVVNGPAATAARVTLGQAPEKPWHVQLRQLLSDPLAMDSKLEIHFQARSPEARKITAGLRSARPPFESLFGKNVSLGPEWKEYVVTGRLDRDFKPNQAQVVFAFGTTPGTIELTGIKVVRQEAAATGAAGKGAAENTRTIDLPAWPVLKTGTLPPPPYKSIVDAISTYQARSSDAGSAGVVPVEGQDFDHAVRLVTRISADQPYKFQLREPVKGTVKRGDVLLALFSYRVIEPNPQSGYAATQFVFEGKSGANKEIIWGISDDNKEWKHVAIPFKVGHPYEPGEAAISFRAAYGPQTIEIGGIELLQLGAGVDPAALPRTAMDYVGSAPDAPWREEAQQRIEKLRKADMVVRVVDADGKPVAGATVEADLTRLDFGIGSAINENFLLPGGKSYDPRYGEKFAELFNLGELENAMKWKAIHLPDIDRKVEDSLQWMESHGMTIRGHNMIWPAWRRSPPEIAQLKDKPEALKKATFDRIATIGQKYSGRIDSWDVINEPYTQNDILEILGDDVMAGWMKAAREADPHARLFINDFSIVEQPAVPNVKADYYLDLARRLKAAGAPLDGIGFQCHFNSLTPIPRVLAMLDEFARAGLAVQITELTIEVPDEDAQVKYLQDFMTAAFSSPNVDMIQLWGFWEPAMFPVGSPAALYRSSWEEKPVGKAFRELVKQTWHTKVEGVTDAKGQFAFRGFKGRYRITAGGPGPGKTELTGAPDKDGIFVLKLGSPAAGKTASADPRPPISR